uniref:Protocadherin gamma-C3 n=1 Tax=Electrophorus electricus TaxID=8005 RepID=A0A4W4E9P2_ELEEL
KLFSWLTGLFSLVLSLLDSVLPQLRYTVHEELEHGAFVGNIAEDLGLDANKLSTRRFRTVSASKKQYLEVNLENGVLFVNDRIDREQLCEQSPYCSFHLQVVIENPLELYIVEVEILDVNDNSPSFPWGEFNLDISESAIPGSRFSLESAQDLDVGDNSLRSYLLSVNEHFVLDIQTRSDGSKFAELILESPLDREQQKTHQMVLTAVDGGLPERSSTTQINIVVLDANDNAPVFDQNFYKVRLVENVPEGTVVIKLNASDLDEGSNGEIAYTFSGHAPMKVRELFTVDSLTGEIKVKGLVDYEKARMHEIYVQAKDKGPSAVAVHCRVLVSVVDVNDNLPEVILTSVSTPVREDAPPGTVIAVISVMDPDSGENGNVHCEIPHHVPFQLYSPFKNHYTLVTNDFLDRETVSEYNVTITARDMGSPPLFTKKSLLVQVYDINDNVPWFKQPSYTVYLTENNAPGASVFTVTAQDADVDQNSYLSYSILESVIQAMPVSTYMSINSDNGNIYALRSFDHEELRKIQHWHFQVQATDSGVPPVSSNVTINMFILDENDNRPVFLPPYSEPGSVNTENTPYSAEAGYFVAKIRAVDADSGYNALLSYYLTEPKGTNLFRIGNSNGEIRTKRRMSDNDLKSHQLCVLVSDHGEPSLSATVTVDVVVVESMDDVRPSLRQVPIKEDSFSDLNLYLLIAIVSVSVIFLLSLIGLIAAKCYRTDGSFRGYSAPVVTTHPDGSWSYSKSTQQYNVCFSSDTLKSDVVVFPSPFPPADAELITRHVGTCYVFCLRGGESRNSCWKFSQRLGS